MKKSITILLFILVSNAFFAQTAFEKYDGKEGVVAIIVDKKMFQMMSSVKVDTNDKDTQEYLDLLKKLDNLKVFTTSDAKIADDMKLTFESYSKSVGLEELIRINEGDKKLKVMVKSGTIGGKIKELLVLSEESINDKETVLMYLTGNFSLNEIYVLTNKMNIPGVENLKKD